MCIEDKEYSISKAHINNIYQMFYYMQGSYMISVYFFLVQFVSTFTFSMHRVVRQINFLYINKILSIFLILRKTLQVLIICIVGPPKNECTFKLWEEKKGRPF